jgi:hypothetical protein
MRYRTVVWTLIRALPWGAATLVSVGSYLLLLSVSSRPAEWSAAGISKETVVRVAGSMFASALFFFVIQLLLSLRTTPAEAEHAYFAHMQVEHGIRDVFVQRGGSEALRKYEVLLQTASRRIWAVGLSNRRFLNHQTPAMEAALIRAGRKSIDVRVVFADPDCRLKFGLRDLSILDVQTHLEDKTEATVDWHKVIYDGIDRLRALPGGPGAGHLSVHISRSPCLFTCFVIDDEVFFFPMLARAGSSQDPTIHVSAKSPIGESICEHLEGMFRTSTYCDCVYDNHREQPAVSLA